MAFTTPVTTIPNIGAGELGEGANHVVYTATVFEDDLKVGRFCKLDTAQIDNMDGSGTPVIAGVVLRSVTHALEQEAVYNKKLYNAIPYCRQGLVTVVVKTGETPALFERVYVSNDTGANDGKATATNTDVAVNAEFVREIKTDVWQIYLTPPPGDIATHIGDATAAHAASSTSIADAGSYTSEVEVEAALQELYSQRPQIVIADPGDGLAIPVVVNGTIALVTGGAETRTVAIPSFEGQMIDLVFNDDGGDCVITFATTINPAGNDTATFDTEGEALLLKGMMINDVLAWRIVTNIDAVALTTA